MSVAERYPGAALRAARRHAALAAAFYLGAALWAVRVVLPAPASTFPHPEYLDWIWCAGCPREVVGLLFGLHPTRIVDLAVPFALGNQWTPLALLFAHRLVTRRRWRDAAGLTLFVNLQTMESLYPLFALAVVGGTYAVYLLARNLPALPALAPKLVAFGAVTAAVAYAILYPLSDFAPGGAAYPGSLLLVFAAVALVDRLRRARPSAQWSARPESPRCCRWRSPPGKRRSAP